MNNFSRLRERDTDICEVDCNPSGFGVWGHRGGGNGKVVGSAIGIRIEGGGYSWGGHDWVEVANRRRDGSVVIQGDFGCEIGSRSGSGERRGSARLGRSGDDRVVARHCVGDIESSGVVYDFIEVKSGGRGGSGWGDHCMGSSGNGGVVHGCTEVKVGGNWDVRDFVRSGSCPKEDHGRVIGSSGSGVIHTTLKVENSGSSCREVVHGCVGVVDSCVQFAIPDNVHKRINLAGHAG